jgi:electron transfer flavoprotein alpha subunit
MAGEIWTIGERKDGALRPSTLEVLAAARRLADAAGARAALVLLGEDLEALGAGAVPYGADVVYRIEHGELVSFRTEAYTAALAALAAEKKPDAILLPATFQGKDLAPRLAARLGTGLVSDVIEVEVGDGGALVFTRPIFAGKARERVTIPDARPQMATLRPKVFPLGSPDASRRAESPRVTPDLPARALVKTVKETLQTGAGRVELVEADTIVSGGRGMKEPANFRILEELAEVLGAAVGASRAAVDAGWREHSDQVGQTGKTVTPNLYIACGISGAIQHLAGMSSARCILAINKDPEAPIFKVADYGIVGDLFEVVPALKEACRTALS